MEDRSSPILYTVFVYSKHFFALTQYKSFFFFLPSVIPAKYLFEMGIVLWDTCDALLHWENLHLDQVWTNITITAFFFFKQAQRIGRRVLHMLFEQLCCEFLHVSWEKHTAKKISQLVCGQVSRDTQICGLLQTSGTQGLFTQFK